MANINLDELSCKDDLLERNEPFIEGIMQLIKGDEISPSNDSTVIAIDSGWGTGKTWLMHMLQNKLKETGEYETVFYNAWECDDWSNALIPFVAQIKDINSKKDDEKESIIESIRDKTTKVGVFLENNWKSIIFKALSQFARKETGIDFESIKGAYNESFKELNLTKDYEDFIYAKEDFKKELAKLGEKKKVVFLIDELDRCKPTFAIETLEVVKHFFDVNNFIFIFAMDMTQLSHSIATVYGQNMDAVGYLRRFFDIQLRIPSPSTKRYLESIVHKDILPKNMHPKISRLIKRIDIISVMDEIYSKFNLSLRDINLISNNYFIFMKYNRVFYSESVKEILSIYLVLFVFKYKKPLSYEKIMNGNFDEVVTDQFKSIRIPFIQDFLRAFRDRMKLEIQLLPNDILKTPYAFEQLKIGSVKENERVYQYREYTNILKGN